jgi:hypothetical protein
MEVDAAVAQFRDVGWTTVRNVLPTAHVAAFVNDVAEDLAAGRGQYDTRGGGGPWTPTTQRRISLADRTTWPQGGERRVAEVAPRGEGAYWRALGCREGPGALALGLLLDTIMGAGAWEMRFNERQEEEGGAPTSMAVRNVYVPASFPEWPDGEASPPACSCGAGCAGCSPKARVAILGPSSELEPTPPARGTPPASAWHVVSRRRVLSKGWHIDVGPGFPSDGVRTSKGDPRQGPIVLLLLTDCAPGEGGTAIIAGSHRWVLRELLRAEAAGSPPTHEALNLWAVRRLRTATEAGRVLIDPQHACDCACSASGSAATPSVELHAEHPDPLHPECALSLHVQQVSGRAGDVVVLHPLALHSGTQVRSDRVRLMANGVARWTGTGSSKELLGVRVV